jgi:hypothetical protein
MFCKLCIDDFKKRYDGSCPVGLDHRCKTRKNAFVRREVMGALVTCPAMFARVGSCDWHGRLSLLAAHVSGQCPAALMAIEIERCPLLLAPDKPISRRSAAMPDPAPSPWIYTRPKPEPERRPTFEADRSSATAIQTYGGECLPEVVKHATPLVITRGSIRSEESRWNFVGPIDAIGVTFATTCILRGVGVFPAAGTTKVQMRLIRGRNSTDDSDVVAMSSLVEISSFSKRTSPVEVMFDNAVLCQAHELYTIEAEQANEADKRSCFIEEGTSIVIASGLRVKFTDAAFSENCTSVARGAIPTLYVLGADILPMGYSSIPSPVKRQWGGDEMSSAVKSHHCEVVKRGTTSSEARRWNHSGAYDCLAFRVDKRCCIRGVGFYPPVGRTLVRVGVVRGVNNDGDLSASYVAESDPEVVESPIKARTPFELCFNKVLSAEAGVLYTIEMVQINADGVSCLVEDTDGETQVDGVTITWTDAEYSPNGTSAEQGAIPCLFLWKDESAAQSSQSSAFGFGTSAFAAKGSAATKQYGGSELPSSVKFARATVLERGRIADSERLWNFSGATDALGVTFDTACCLRGVGVLPCAGTTKVQVRMTKGKNSDGDSAYISMSDWLEITSFEKSTKPVEVMFNELVFCEGHQLYTVEVEQNNASGEKSCYVDDGQRGISGGSIRALISAAESSPNYTSVESGAIPTLYVLPVEHRRSARSTPMEIKRQFWGGADLARVVRTKDIQPELRGTVASEAGRWNHSGGYDCISFRVDMECTMRGVGFFPPVGACKVMVGLLRGENSDSDMSSAYIAQSEVAAVTSPMKARTPFEICFKDVVRLEPSTQYTVEMVQVNADGVSCLIEGGSRTSDCGPVTITWSDARSSGNGTSLEQGTIPCLYLWSEKQRDSSHFSDKHTVIDLDAAFSEMFAESADDDIEIRRGAFECADWRWNHAGPMDAVSIMVSKPCFLAAVGVFPGSGTTTVKVRVIYGLNAEGMSDSDTRVIARSEEKFYFETEKAARPKKLKLTQREKLSAGSKYTIEVHQRNSASARSYFVTHGKVSVESSGLKVTFLKANFSPNGRCRGRRNSQAVPLDVVMVLFGEIRTFDVQ